MMSKDYFHLSLLHLQLLGLFDYFPKPGQAPFSINLVLGISRIFPARTSADCCKEFQIFEMPERNHTKR